MHPDTPSRRRAAQIALIVGPLLSAVSVILQPDLDGSAHHQLVAIGDSSRGAISAVTFLVSQLPFLIAVLAIGRLLLPRAPRLSAWGTALGVLGAFGHSVFGGISMVYVVMAHDPKHLDVYAHLMDRMNDSPVMIFSAAGLLGTILGILLLGIGLFRTRTGPVWIGPALWAFLLVEFVGSSISSSASYLSALLLVAAFFALSREVAEAPAPARVERQAEPVG
jgi:hypothetical protein